MSSSGQERDPIIHIITMKDVYDHVVGLKETVTLLPEKIATLEKGFADHEHRLRKQETRNFPLTSVTTILAVLMFAVAVTTFLLKF